MSDAAIAAYEAKGITGDSPADIATKIQPPDPPAASVDGSLKPAEPETPPEKVPEVTQPPQSSPGDAEVDTSAGTQAASEAKPADADEDPETPYFRNSDGTFRKGSKKEIRGIVNKQQKRIDTLTAKLRAIEAQPPAAAPTLPTSDHSGSAAATPDDPKPSWDAFVAQGKSSDDWAEAMGRWSARQEWKALQRTQQQTETEQEAGNIRAELIGARIEAFAAEHPDYNSVVSSGPLSTLPLPAVLLQILSGDERGPEMAYYLAKNPDDALALVKDALDLPNRPEAIEWMRHRVLLRLGSASSARGSDPQAPKLSLAPPPMRPVSGGANTATVPLDKLTADVDGDFDKVRPQWRKAMRG
jgi:hypothetical protein